jgi:hypothetical protein
VVRCGRTKNVDEREIENADNLEDALDEQGRNVTQQRMDADGVEDRPVDVDDDAA